MLGEYLKRKRLDLNIDQTEMAARLGTSQSYYSQLESGARKPGFRMIRAIALEFGTDPAELRKLIGYGEKKDGEAS